jgi:hypothetical protein
MKKVLFALALAASVAVASAQTKPAKKVATKECCKKEGASCCKEKETAVSEASCCSPSSKAKALVKAKPATVKKG